MLYLALQGENYGSGNAALLFPIHDVLHEGDWQPILTGKSHIRSQELHLLKAALLKSSSRANSSNSVRKREGRHVTKSEFEGVGVDVGVEQWWCSRPVELLANLIFNVDFI